LKVADCAPDRYAQEERHLMIGNCGSHITGIGPETFLISLLGGKVLLHFFEIFLADLPLA